MPDVTPASRATMVAALEKDTLLGNPLDCENTRHVNPEQFARAIDALCNDPNIEVVAYRMNSRGKAQRRLLTLYRDLLRHTRNAGKMPVFLSRAAENLGSEWFQFFEENDVAFLVSYYTGLVALHHLFAWRTRAAARRKPQPKPGAIPAAIAPPPQQRGRAVVLPETQRLLRNYRFPMYLRASQPRRRKLAEAAKTLGFPVVAKIASADLPHKSDAGAVRLRLGPR